MRAAHDRVLSDLRLAQDKKGESIFEASVASEFFTPFAIGDFVWYKKSDLKKSKLELLSLGPYRVIKIHSPYSYGISDVNTKKERDAHYTFLSPVDPELAQALSGGEGGVNYADSKIATDFPVDIVDTLPLGIANSPASDQMKAAERKRMNRR
jgi:hypothetical protein